MDAQIDSDGVIESNPTDIVQYSGATMTSATIPDPLKYRAVVSLSSEYWTPRTKGTKGDKAVARLIGWGEANSNNKTPGKETYRLARFLGTIFTAGGTKAGVPMMFVMGQDSVTRTLHEMNVPLNSVVEIVYSGQKKTTTGNVMDMFDITLLEASAEKTFPANRARSGIAYIDKMIASKGGDIESLVASYSEAYEFAAHISRQDNAPTAMELRENPSEKNMNAAKELLERIVEFHESPVVTEI